MPFINPFSYGGAVKFDIKASYTAPTEAGKNGDIVLVFPYKKGRPVYANYVEAYVAAFLTKTNDTTYPWTTVDGVLQSTMHTASKSATYRIDFNTAGSLSLQYYVSSESVSYDYLTISKNGTQLAKMGGTSNVYTDLEVEIAAGDYVTFTYKKDGGGDGGTDTAHIKGLEFIPDGGIPQSVYDEYEADLVAFDKANPVPDVSNIKVLAVVNNFDQALGNIYPDNTVVLFCKNAGTLGTNLLHYKTKNLALDVPIVSTVAVVNHNGMQAKCDVYVYNTEAEQWQTSSYVQLPAAVTEIIDITALFGSPTVSNLVEELGIIDQGSTESKGGTYNEQLDLAVLFGTLTASNLLNDLGLAEEATATTGTEVIPLT